MSDEERTGYRSGDPKFRPPPPNRSADKKATVGGAGSGSSEGRLPTTPQCDLCGSPMLDRNCKLVCTGCGYQRDCSDP
jgi:hypothetical protein